MTDPEILTSDGRDDAWFSIATGGALEALYLNPVIVHPRGQRVSVADAGIVTAAARREV